MLYRDYVDLYKDSISLVPTKPPVRGSIGTRFPLSLLSPSKERRLSRKDVDLA